MVKSKIKVEDHGNGFMVVGVQTIKKARKVLRDYVDDVEPYRFACPTYYDGTSSVWLSTGPGEHWDGAVDHTGKPMR
jgi:spermidine synthase